MKISTHYEPNSPWPWTAIDENTYDGSPDAGPSARIVGIGATKAAAIADLIEQLGAV
jgi:hypothetical protein